MNLKDQIQAKLPKKLKTWEFVAVTPRQRKKIQKLAQKQSKRSNHALELITLFASALKASINAQEGRTPVQLPSHIKNAPKVPFRSVTPWSKKPLKPSDYPIARFLVTHYPLELLKNYLSAYMAARFPQKPSMKGFCEYVES